MKHIFFIPLLLSICLAPSISTMNKIEGNKPTISHSDRLNKVRAETSQAINKIGDILNNLCKSLHDSLGEASDLVCQQLSILHVCTQTIGSRISDMNEKELLHLIALNDALLDQIKNQIIEEHYTDFSDINPSDLFGTMLDNKDNFITIEQIQYKLKNLEKKISAVAELIEHLAETIDLTIQPEPWLSTISNYKGTIFTSLLAVGTAYILRNQDPLLVMKTVLTRIPVYGFLALYVLRQKKDSDTKKWLNSSFGEDSSISNVILGIKQLVGSPREKRPAVHIIARDDMTAQEQIQWAEDNNCEFIKTDYRKRAIPYLCNFFDLDDSLFKFSFSLIFAQQVRADVLALSELMGTTAESIVKRMLNPTK